MWLTLRQGLGPVATGLAIGIAISVGFAIALRGILFGIAPAAPQPYLVAALGLVLAATAATLLPAARATRLDPLVVLRHE